MFMAPLILVTMDLYTFIPALLSQGFVGSRAIPESGGALAMRALGFGTLYAVGGVGLFCFGIWKLTGAKTVSDYELFNVLSSSHQHVTLYLFEGENSGHSLDFSSTGVACERRQSPPMAITIRNIYLSCSIVAVWVAELLIRFYEIYVHYKSGFLDVLM